VKRARDGRFETSRGTLVLIEESHDLPLVDFEMVLRSGAVHDPARLQGLTRMTWRVVRMGTARMTSRQVEENLSQLGASLSIEVTSSSVRISASVIRRNLEPLLKLVSELILEPAFRPADLGLARRETIADIVGMRDSDKSLGARAFREFLFGDHPYAHSLMGTQRTVKAISRQNLVACYEQHLTAKNTIIAIAGDIRVQDAERLVRRFFSALPKGTPPIERVPVPEMVSGRRVLIVDKPERTQTQIFAGQLGLRAGDPLVFPLSVANTAFGGTFTARLMQQVRAKRGWSYGAYSRLGQDRERDAWYMWTFPAAKDAVECLALELRMLEEWLEKGITTAEHKAVTDYLVKSHCFDIDTAVKRLSHRVEVELFGLSADHYEKYPQRIGKVTRAQANRAARNVLSSDHLAIVVVATASEVKKKLAKLPGVRSVDVVSFEQETLDIH